MAKKIIIVSIVALGIAILFLIYWFVPFRTYTYQPNGQKVFSIKYPLRFSNTIVQYGDYLDIGKATGGDNDVMLHFIYYSGDSTFNNQPNGDGTEIAYSTVKTCDDLEKNDSYRVTYGKDYLSGYKSEQVDGRTLCYLNNDQQLGSTDSRGILILNPSPTGALSLLYPQNATFQVGLMIKTIKIFK